MHIYVKSKSNPIGGQAQGGPCQDHLKADDLWKGEIRKRQVEKGAKRLPALFHVKHKQPLRWDRRFNLKWEISIPSSRCDP